MDHLLINQLMQRNQIQEIFSFIARSIIGVYTLEMAHFSST